MTAREQHIARLMGQIPLERFGRLWDELTAEEQQWCEQEATERVNAYDRIVPFIFVAAVRRAAA